MRMRDQTTKAEWPSPLKRPGRENTDHVMNMHFAGGSNNSELHSILSCFLVFS